jgi:uncharacterized membrane protein YfcA
MAFAPILDPWFYAVAVPAVLLLGISKSGFGSGFGSLAVPMMALVTTVPVAAAILMPVLFVMDILGIVAYRRDFDRALLKFLVPKALLGVLVGALTFHALDAKTVAGLVGVLTLVFLAQRVRQRTQLNRPPMPTWLGGLLTATSGFTSFVAHAGGPPVNAYLLPMRLSPVTYTATMAYLFLVVNLSKWIPYGMLGLLNMENFATAMVLLPLAPLGVWVGVRMARKIDPVVFYRVAYVGMALTGIKLTWDGWLA